MATPSAVVGSSQVSPVAEPVLLLIADISGYTRYMTANAKTLAHSQTIITELVKALLQNVELPLEVAKLEGDAVFMYSRFQSNGDDWRRNLPVRILSFFDVFHLRLRELSASTVCTCNACTHIDQLRMKLIVHAGEALFHDVLHFRELAGLDVIIVHRLLKNSITMPEYVLLTTSAKAALQFPEGIDWRAGTENYSDIGRIETFFSTCTRSAAAMKDITIPEEIRPPFGQRFKAIWATYWKLWFAPLRRGQSYHHLPTSTTKTGRVFLSALAILLAPFMGLVAPLFVGAQALKGPHTQRIHPADCPCCKANRGD